MEKNLLILLFECTFLFYISNKKVFKKINFKFCFILECKSMSVYSVTSLSQEEFQNHVQNYLNCIEGKLICKHYQDFGILDNINRCALARLIVYSELGDINFFENYIPKISTLRFQSLAEQITQIFQSEEPTTYYLPYMARGNNSPSGKLYDAYNYVKKKFRKAGVLTPKFRRQKNLLSPKSEHF